MGTPFPQERISQPSIRFMFGVSLLLGVMIALAAAGFAGYDIKPAPGNAILFGISLVFGLATAIICMQSQSNDIAERSQSRMATLLGASVVLTSMVAFLNPGERLATFGINAVTIDWLLFGLCQLCLVYTASFLMVSCLQVKGNWPTFVASGMSIMILLGCVVGIATPALIDRSVMKLIVALMRETGVLSLLLVIAIISLTSRELRLSPRGLTETLRIRLTPSRGNRKELIAAGLFVLAGAALSLILTLKLLVVLNKLPLEAGFIKALMTSNLELYSFAWIGALWLGFSHLITQQNHTESNTTLLKLINPSTKRFLNRFGSNQSFWAATVGLRTASFVLDHDPKKSLQTQLPATVLQIRGDEIQRAIGQMLGQHYLYSRVIDDSIIGTMDPEQTYRPCVDVLNLFASLYLDAIPLVERRLKRLAELLPLIDPNLADHVPPNVIGQITSRSGWLFYLAYDWTDQLVIGRPNEMRYGVQTRDLVSSVRDSVLDLLYRENRLGNFVWVSDHARVQLAKEAPLISAAITSYPLSLDGGKEELPIFLIKFEDLIPRLQKYYNLDLMRELLRDYEPSRESVQLLNLLDLQLSEPISPQHCQAILGTIASYPWRGFKEKDSVLQLVLKAYEQMQVFVNNNEYTEEMRVAIVQSARNHFSRTIQSIGYPSQSLHQAQMDKSSIRSMKNKLAIATEPAHPRFHESWLLLASADASRFSQAEVTECLHFIGRVCENPKLAHDPFVGAKALQALMNFGQKLKPDDVVMLSNLLNPLIKGFIQHNFEPDLIAMLLDTIIFFEGVLERSLQINAENVLQLNLYVASISRQFGAQTPIASAISARWEQIQQRAMDASNLKAS